MFKVGDRIAVYLNSCPSIKTKIANLRGDGMIGIGELDYYVHPKQCRKLVKKERREVWIFQNVSGTLIYDTLISYKPDELQSNQGKWIRFVETNYDKN